MGNRHLTKILLACLGIVIILSLQGSPRIAEVLAPLGAAKNPVYSVQAFFKAMERGDWLKAKTLTTPEYWGQLEQQGQIRVWQDSLQQDTSLEFTGFTVLASTIEAEKAVIDGRAVWVSAQGSVPRKAQTITLERGLGGWYISSIQTKESSEVVESFYMYLNQGQWEKAKALVNPETWRLWEARGLLSKLKAGYGKRSPYVNASISNAWEKENQAEATVDLVWMIPQEVKTKTTVKLSKTGDKWVIRQIEEGWPK